MRREPLLGLAVLVALVAPCACDDAIERDTPPRYYIPPDAGDLTPDPPVTEAGTTPSGDAASDAPAPPKPFDPATLSLSGWWRATYGGSPWVGTESAGVSKGRDLGEATNPPIAGTPVNKLTPAKFDGVNDLLTSFVPVNTFLATAGYEVHGLFSADSAQPYVAGTPYAFPAIATEAAAGDFYVAFSSAGVMAGHWDGAVFHEVVSPCPTGGLHLFQAWFDGKNLNLAIDGGTPATPVPTGTPIFGTGALKVGVNFSNAAAFDGVIVELMMAPTVFDAPTRSAIRSYFNTRYGTAFPP